MRLDSPHQRRELRPRLRWLEFRYLLWIMLGLAALFGILLLLSLATHDVGLMHGTGRSAAAVAVALAMVVCCGIAVQAAAARQRLRLQASEADERLCLNCHHDLRGLSGEGKCPECGEPFKVHAVQAAWRRELALPARGIAGVIVRQFTGPRTGRQDAFDLVFGIFLPLGCFLFDPIVFTPSGVLGEYWYMAHSGVLIQWILLGVWLSIGKRLMTLGAFISGGMLVGAAVAGLLGLVLAPIATVGLIVFIGIFGFTPLFTSFVYLRAGVRAMLVVRAPWRRKHFILFSLGACLACGVPLAVHTYAHTTIDRAINTLTLSTDPAEVEAAIDSLRIIRAVNPRHVRARFAELRYGGVAYPNIEHAWTELRLDDAPAEPFEGFD